jgi:hypothetical protein
MKTSKLKDIVGEILREESEAAKAAKAQGLESMGFGRWGKDGKVLFVTKGGKLEPFEPGGKKRTSQQATQQAATDEPTTAQGAGSAPVPKEGKFSEAIYRGIRSGADKIADAIDRVIEGPEDERTPGTRKVRTALAMGAGLIGGAIVGAMAASGTIGVVASELGSAVGDAGLGTTAQGLTKLFATLKGYDYAVEVGGTLGFGAGFAGLAAGVATSAGARRVSKWADDKLRDSASGRQGIKESTELNKDDIARRIATIDNKTILAMKAALKKGIVDDEGNITDENAFEKIYALVNKNQ